MAGASAVLPPETTSEQLIESVQAVAAGRRWRARHDTEATRKRAARRTPAHPALALLSVRERQIAQGIAVGKRNREIAEAYGISPGTVKLHLNKIYGKLGVNSRLALYRKLAAAGGLSD
jgi:DNA-binding NarL/FixJ family response regulator